MSRPYFETKVVKVKKAKIYSNHIIIDGKKYILYEDEEENVYPHKKKGNWVNGENLDKIKFPCFCRYNGKYFGIIYVDKEDNYGLINIDKQRDKWCIEDNGWVNLNNMINNYNIHILKGKIIIFEEV